MTPKTKPSGTVALRACALDRAGLVPVVLPHVARDHVDDLGQPREPGMDACGVEAFLVPSPGIRALDAERVGRPCVQVLHEPGVHDVVGRLEHSALDAPAPVEL